MVEATLVDVDIAGIEAAVVIEGKIVTVVVGNVVIAVLALLTVELCCDWGLQAFVCSFKHLVLWKNFSQLLHFDGRDLVSKIC